MRLSVGKDPADASARRQRKEAELNAVNNGVAVVPDGENGNRSVAAAVADFLDETKLTKKPKTLPGLHFHDLRRTAARNMRRGHVAEKVAMEVGGWKTTSVFHRYAIVDNQDIADAMDMLERSQDEQRQRLEVGPVAKGEGAVATNVDSQQCGHQRETSGSSSGNFAVTSRLHHVEDFAAIFRRLHRGTTRPRKPSRDRDLSAGAGRGSRTPKGRSPADFENTGGSCAVLKVLYFIRF